MTFAGQLDATLEAFDLVAPLEAEAELAPPAKPRVLLSRRQLARALGRNLNTLNRWHDAGMPFVEAGIGGRGYQYDVDEVKAWREQVEREERERREAVEGEVQRHLSLEGGSGDDPLVDLTLEQRTKHYANERQRLALTQTIDGLVDRRKLRAEFEQVFAYMADRLQTLPDVLERKVQLSPRGVAEVLDLVDDLQREMAEVLEGVDDLDELNPTSETAAGAGGDAERAA